MRSGFYDLQGNSCGEKSRKMVKINKKIKDITRKNIRKIERNICRNMKQGKYYKNRAKNVVKNVHYLQKV